MIRFLVLLPLLTGFLAPQGAVADESDWWRDAVFYQIFVRSFQDASEGPFAGDGIGDFDGIVERLDYLNDGDPNTDTDLGIDAIWLLPINESASYHGYDIIDYKGVEEDYGDLDSFKRFLDEAHKRGIKVILDMVFNHTSTQHRWFVEAAAQDEHNDKTDLYVFADEALHSAGPWGEQAWHFLNGWYYYGVFWSGMPDLNFENPKVTEHFYDVARYWLEDVGVDGFRLDAVRFLYEDGDLLQDTPETKQWLKEFTEYCKTINPDAFVIGEVWSDTLQISSYVDGGSVDSAFEFDYAKAMIESSKFGASRVYTIRQERVAETWGDNVWSAFLSNHDKDRVMSQLESDWDAAALAASLLLTNRGIPFIYYGEEIGMVGSKPDPQIRTPMQWTGEPGAGFSTSEPWIDIKPDYRRVNVADQTDDPESLLNTYRRLINARKASPALVHGEEIPLQVQSRGAIASLRATEDEVVLLLINFRDRPSKKWSLSLASSELQPAGEIRELLHDTPVTLPEWSEDGGFEGWKPFDEVGPKTAYLLHWRR